MKLVDEIIGLLSSDSAPVAEALLKTKVLLHAIGKKELVEWVNNELTGYPKAEVVPSYRVLRGRILANLSNLAWRGTAHPIPLEHLDEEQRANLETVPMHQSLSELEKLASSSANSTVISFPFPLEANGFLGKNLGNGFQIELAWTSVPKASIAGSFIQVRSRLLDFVLGLNDKLEGAITEQEVRTRTGTFDASGMFSQAIFGDNATIIVGQENTQTVKNITSVKGDFRTLANELRQNGMAEDDINALKAAIASDDITSEVKNSKFGPTVKQWMQQMWGKALEASWNIDLGIVSGLLTTAIQKYYGWS